jgi:CheY-like chemotaxis protein
MGGVERVLVVEDEPEVLALLRDLLRCPTWSSWT